MLNSNIYVFLLIPHTDIDEGELDTDNPWSLPEKYADIFSAYATIKGGLNLFTGRQFSKYMSDTLISSLRLKEKKKKLQQCLYH